MTAIADRKMLIVQADNSDGGKLYITHETRGELLLASLTPDIMAQLEAYSQFEYGADMSLCEFKKMVPQDIRLNQPELFGQILLSLVNPYTSERGWVQEYVWDRFRLDMAYVKKHNEQDVVLMFNECKHSEQSDFKETMTTTFRDQLLNYCQAIYDVTHQDIIGNVFVFDGNYLFNNPQIVGNIAGTILNNTSYFMSQAFVYDKNGLTQINQKGVTDIIPVKTYLDIPIIDEICIIFKPEAVYGINTLSNPRAREESKVSGLMLDIASDMLTSIQNKIDYPIKRINEIYRPTDFTIEKQIQTLGKPTIFESKKQKYLYDLGLSLSNGQHSVAAYARLMRMIWNDECEYHKYPLYSKVSEIVASIKETLIANYGSSAVEMFCRGIFLKAKITTASSKDEEKALATASNTTVGVVDTTLPLMEPVIKKINDIVYKNNINNPDIDSIIQLYCPHSQQLQNSISMDYSILGLLPELKSRTLSKFRQGGFKTLSSEGLLNKFYLSRITRTQMMKYKKNIEAYSKEIEDLNNRLEDEDPGSSVFSLFSEQIGRLQDEIKKMKEKVDVVQCYEENNIDVKEIEKFIRDLDDLTFVFNFIHRMGYKDNHNFHKAKLTFGLMSQYSMKSSEISYQNKGAMENLVKVVDCLCSNKIDINKNSLFNDGNVSNKIEKYIYNFLLSGAEFDEQAFIEQIVNIFQENIKGDK